MLQASFQYTVIFTSQLMSYATATTYMFICVQQSSIITTVPAVMENILSWRRFDLVNN